MKNYRVILTRRADIHLAALRAFIESRDGPWKANSAIQKILLAFRRLETLPVRGIVRPDLGEGLRSWKATKRTTIVFEIDQALNTVVIHGIFTGGRDIETYFKVN
jgi:plasmid stabilization system protein ParE